MIESLRISRAAAFAALALLAGGCIPLPYATPPLRVAVSSGAARGHAIEQGSAGATDVGAAAVSTARIGIHPLQLTPDMQKVLDVGAGYVADMESRPAPHPLLAPAQGAYLESTFWPAVASWSPQTALRFGATADLDLLFADARTGGHDVGLGALAGVTLELSHYCTSPIEGSSGPSQDSSSEVKRTDIVGVAAGEVSIAATAQVGYRWIGPQSYWLAVFGLSFRVPATAGLFLFWLL